MAKDINFGKKPTLSLVPAVALIYIAKAMEDGAKKRGPYNWRETRVSASNLIDKMERHIQLLKDRHDFADDSGLHELAHCLADGCVYLDAMESGVLDDDRPVAGKANEVMNRFSNGKTETVEAKLDSDKGGFVPVNIKYTFQKDHDPQNHVWHRNLKNL